MGWNRDERSWTFKTLGLWIRRLIELLNLPVILLDLGAHRRDLLEHWAEGFSQPWRYHCQGVSFRSYQFNDLTRRQPA
jgi:hypothetical protein